MPDQPQTRPIWILSHTLLTPWYAVDEANPSGHYEVDGIAYFLTRAEALARLYSLLSDHATAVASKMVEVEAMMTPGDDQLEGEPT